jgi:chromosome segregation ATPase
MFVDISQDLILFTAGAFVLGWLLSLIISRLSARRRATKQDPRDVRIRELEAELRIAQGDSGKSRSELEDLEEKLKETKFGLERRDDVISEQQSKIEKIQSDLKYSVIKTRELRAELADRATENVHAEAKIREVETELSVAHASTDMLASGILEYRHTPEMDDENQQAVNEYESPGTSKTAN